ncbi:MAG: hypothetical protein GX111_07555 [Clostridiales bacterium]|nr:hypothetical protein [Clostridiales bacterium]
MSFIACVSDCVYQKDGCCSLERAASGNENGVKNNACIHYVQINSGKKKKTENKESSDSMSCGCL